MMPPVLPYLDAQALSGITGSVSIACWIIVFTPQLYENFQRQSAEGLSLTFINLWLIGDVFNVIGSVLQGVLPTMTILAVYYTIADIILLIQCLVYNNGDSENSKGVDPRHLSPATPLLDGENLYYGTEYHGEMRHHYNEQGEEEFVPRWKQNMYHCLIVFSVVLSGVIGWYFTDNGSDDLEGGDSPQVMNFWGQFNGWCCCVFYLGSRIPQLLLNHKNQSTEGLSFLFFLFAVLGNITYVISILVKDMSRDYLLINASWLAGSAGTLVLDFIIFCQFWVYRDD